MAFEEDRKSITDDPREGHRSASRTEVEKTTVVVIIPEEQIKELAALLDI